MEKTIGFVRGVGIKVIVDDEELVPVKPICEALGIDYPTQFTRLKEDPILSSVVGLNPTTGKDGKTYEMQCLPIKYVFGWLFRIDSRNVKEEAKSTLLEYQLICYDVLYNYFHGRITEADKLLKDKVKLQREINELKSRLFNENQTYKELVEKENQLKSFGNPYTRLGSAVSKELNEGLFTEN
jgi:hypothetical protein